MSDVQAKRDRILALEKELAEARLDVLKTFPAFHRERPREDILGWARAQLPEALFGEPFEDEVQRAKAWVEKHYGEECPLRARTLGCVPAVLSLTVCPTSIATIRSLRCLCGAEITLTDMDKV